MTTKEHMTEQPCRFVYQQNQYNAECLPCTAPGFKTIVNSGEVAWKIATRQAVDMAIRKAFPLTPYINNTAFKRFCEKRDTSPHFAQLTLEQKLIQWTNSLKESLPCFIYAASYFDLAEVVDKDGKPVLGEDGKPLTRRSRRLEGIHLSGLFMFDADHLPIDPREIHERTQVKGFPWDVRLSHKTSSGQGLRLVCEARLDVGNIADNQIELARELGLIGVIGTTGKPVVDDSCIDASRISYAPRQEDIYFIDEDKLFNV